MASPQEMETLHCTALNEQFTAALEGRQPDIASLNEFGHELLQIEAPIVCDSDRFYYRGYNRATDEYHVTGNLTGGSVVGRFGGFLLGNIENETKELGTVTSSEVCYFVMDTARTDLGYVTPVQSSKIEDPVDLIGDNDPIYEELAELFDENRVDIRAIATLLEAIDVGHPKALYYSAFLSGSLLPSDLYDCIYSNGFYIKENSGGKWPFTPLQASAIRITDTDVFTLLDADNSHTLFIRKNRRSGIYIPISTLVGYDRVTQ